MNVGILTYHCVPNFGAQLQTLSTIGYLKQKGHNPIVLHWYPDDLKSLYEQRVPQKQLVEHEIFCHNAMHLSKLCRTEDELIAVIDSLNIDAIFFGSDALFKYLPENERYYFSKRKMRFFSVNPLSVERAEGNPFFGGFLSKIDSNIRAVAFSISSQNCPYFKLKKKEKEVLSGMMKNFSAITVRDDWTQKMVSAILKCPPVKVTPDPVFAINQNCSSKILSKDDVLKKYSLPENYILISFWTNKVPNEYVNVLVKKIEYAGLVPVAFPMPEGLKQFNMTHSIPIPLSPVDWYSLIKYSRGYIGERMHPIVVALHNAVPFFCFDEYGTMSKSFFGLRKRYLRDSSKTYHILQKAGLTDYLYSYRSKQPLLRTDDIISKIQAFPKDKCKSFAEEMLKLYNKTMNNMLSHLFPE